MSEKLATSHLAAKLREASKTMERMALLTEDDGLAQEKYSASIEFAGLAGELERGVTKSRLMDINSRVDEIRSKFNV